MTESGAKGRTSVHATAVVYRESGVLILGPSGSGKSALALALMARARSVGAFAALIGDDRVYVREAEGGRIVVSGAASTAGIIERRTVGLLAVRHEPAAVLRLAVELSERGEGWPRMPEASDAMTIGRVRLPRLALDSGVSAADQAIAVEEQLVALAAQKQLGISLEQSPAVHKNAAAEPSPPI